MINYLSNYVRGNVISDARIIDYDGQHVTIRFKDYKAGDVKTFKLERGEFVRRFAMHIQPRGSKRVRYAGIFTARGREACLALCSRWIAELRAKQPGQELPANSSDLLLEERNPASDDFEEADPHRTSCYCRTCQGDLELLGRLKGTETKAMQSLAQLIVFRMLSYFVEVAEVGYKELLFQLRIAWLTPRRLPQPIRELFIARQRLTSIECGVLEAFVIEELHNRNHTSGIPSPATPASLAPVLRGEGRGRGVTRLEPSHVA